MKISGDVVLSYIQGRFFEKSALAFPCIDSVGFTRLFMHTAGRYMDRIGDDIPVCSVIHHCRGCLDHARRLYGSAVTFNPDALFWIGYVYRMWQRRTALSSWEIYKLADPEWLYFKVWSAVPPEPIAAIRRIYRLKGLTPPDLGRNGK